MKRGASGYKRKTRKLNKELKSLKNKRSVLKLKQRRDLILKRIILKKQKKIDKLSNVEVKKEGSLILLRKGNENTKSKYYISPGDTILIKNEEILPLIDQLQLLIDMNDTTKDSNQDPFHFLADAINEMEFSQYQMDMDNTMLDVADNLKKLDKPPGLKNVIIDEIDINHPFQEYKKEMINVYSELMVTKNTKYDGTSSSFFDIFFAVDNEQANIICFSRIKPSFNFTFIRNTLTTEDMIKDETFITMLKERFDSMRIGIVCDMV